MTKIRNRIQLSKEQYRNLRQNKLLSDDEFDEKWFEYSSGEKLSADFEKRIQDKIDSFSQDYDLDDLKANDNLVLRALAQSYIQLEDLERFSNELRSGGLSLDRMMEMEKLSNMMSKLRGDISKMQDDLAITRRIRKGDKELTVVAELERLKLKAKEFYEQKMFYIFCEKCNMLLATTWFLYPDSKSNKLELKCSRKLDNDEVCGHITRITSKDLLEKRGINSDNVPEFFK
jgi:hypothetical protein